MKPSGVELLRVQMPLVAPFRTSFGTQDVRELLLVRVVTPNCEGWGECVTMGGPLYSSEYVDGAEHVLRNFLVPALLEAGEITASRVAPLLARFKGHRMAKAALEMAVLDAELRAHDLSFAAALGVRTGLRSVRGLGRHHGLRLPTP